MTTLTPEDGCAVVTGAGSGLGRELALLLARKGFAVAAVGRRSDALEETRALDPSGNIHPQPFDVSDSEAVAEGFARIRAQQGPVALLINNAAVYPRRDFLDETDGSYQQTVAINLGGMVMCTRQALRDMVRTGRGRVLNVSSYADLAPLPASSAYSVSKGAARIFTRSLVADLADRYPEIVIGDWMPGMLRTTMGIPDGTPPEIAAQWGVSLALELDPSLMGTAFERELEILPPRGLKSRIKDRLLMRRRQPRRLSQA